MPGLLLWIVPSLLWVAVRFGPLGAATALLCVAALSLWGTASQQGPFVLALSVENVTSLQLFWIVLGAPVLLLAASIREREQVEAALHEQRNQLAHITRVATVGELSGALAHELRQPLTAILANAQAGIHMLSAQKVDLNELREILKDISEQDMHAASVISHLRSLLREGESQFEEISIETIVRDALALGRNTIATSGVNVQAQIAGGLPRVHGDPVQLLQVMLNLIVNGCEATVSKPTAERQLWLQVTRPDQKHVEVRITDSGVGLPVGREERVFEPFFTTKDKGLGLGLSIGRSIVRAHGGRLWGENSAQGGATFYLLLPADEVHSAPAPG
jgi:two-component system sensor kinase FixL